MKHLPLLLGVLLAGSVASAQMNLPPGAHDPDEQAPSSSSSSAPPATGHPGSIPPALAAAEDRIAAHDFAAARASLEGYLRQHPNDARALFDRGYIEDSTGQQDAAEGDYKQAIAADPQQFEARAALGLLYAQTDRGAQAMSMLESATKLQPATNDPAAKAQVWRSLAQLQLAADPAAAQQSLLTALRLDPGHDSPADLILTGQIAEANDDAADAETAYRRALAIDPGSAGATAGLAHLLLQQKKPQEADALLRAALQKHPDDAGLTAQLVTALAQEGDSAGAIDALEKLHQRQPGNANISGMLADLYLRNGAPDKAAPLLAAAVEAQPHNAGLLTSYGQSLIYTRQFAAAVPVLERAVAADPKNDEAWGGLAFAHSQLHQDSAVLHDLEARAKIAPETPETLFLRATSYDNLHQTKAAAEFYERFLAVANGKYPTEEWQAKHRLVALGHGR